MALVFPKVTKCTFYKSGPTGTIQVNIQQIILQLFFYYLCFCCHIIHFLNLSERSPAQTTIDIYKYLGTILKDA
jgi:hypothetical protein